MRLLNYIIIVIYSISESNFQDRINKSTTQSARHLSAWILETQKAKIGQASEKSTFETLALPHWLPRVF